MVIFSSLRMGVDTYTTDIFAAVADDAADAAADAAAAVPVAVAVAGICGSKRKDDRKKKINNRSNWETHQYLCNDTTSATEDMGVFTLLLGRPKEERKKKIQTESSASKY
ncbi:hypothetical protein PGQ11_010956 [Apiospora arundinis]|uniref:Uncharacterized protein n=1 Tax=Apiospora arundinis TaxID=335852 RepID=A0ABR2HY41_9PEZI